MSEHTKGPWVYEAVKTSCGLCHKVGPFPSPEYMRGIKKESHACIYDDYPPTGGSSELVANARLIAAAPELLDLVKLVHGSFGGGRTITFSDDDISEFAAAIAQVEGEPQ